MKHPKLLTSARSLCNPSSEMLSSEANRSGKRKIINQKTCQEAQGNSGGSAAIQSSGGKSSLKRITSCFLLETDFSKSSKTKGIVKTKFWGDYTANMNKVLLNME